MTIEIPAALQWVSYLAGSEWPKGDETAMFHMGDDWNDSSQQLAALIPNLQQVTSKALSVLSGDTGDAAAQQFQTLFSGDYSVQNIVTAMSTLGSLSRNTGTQIEYTKLQVLSTLAITAAEITYLIAMADWTFGMSLFEIPVVEGITIAVIRTIVSQLVRRLLTAVAEALTKTAIKTFIKEEAVKLLGAGLREAVQETVISEIQELAIEGYQVAVGHRDGFDIKQILEVGGGAALGAFTASLLHGPVTHALGEATTIAGKVFNGVVTHYGLGFVGNAVGSAATGGVDAVSLFLGPATGGIHGAVHGLAHHGTGEPHADVHKPDDSPADGGDQEKLGKDDPDGKWDPDTATLVGDDEKEAEKDEPLHDHWDSDTETLNGDPRGESNGPQSPTDGIHSGTTPVDDQNHGATASNGNTVPSDSAPSHQEGATGQNGNENTLQQPAGSENGSGSSQGPSAVGNGGFAPQHGGTTGASASTVNGHSNSVAATSNSSTPQANSATVTSTNSPGNGSRTATSGQSTESSSVSAPPSRTSESGSTSASRAGAGAAASRGGAGAPAARSADAAVAKAGSAGLSSGHRDQTPQAEPPVYAEPPPEPDRIHDAQDDAVGESSAAELDPQNHSQDSSPPSLEKPKESLEPDDDDQIKEPGPVNALPRADTSIDEVRSWLPAINSDIRGADVYDRMLNCGPATIAVFDRLSDRPSFQTAPPLTEGILKQQLRDVTGFAPQRTSLQGIEQTLRSQGAGAHAVVFVARRGPDNASTAHAFNAFFDGAKVYALDGQDNSVQEWPPNFDAGDFKAVEWSVYAPPHSVPHLDMSGASASSFRATDIAFGSHWQAGPTLPHEETSSPEYGEESDYVPHSGSDEESAREEGDEWDNRSGFELDDEADFLFDDESDQGYLEFDHDQRSPEEVRAQRTADISGHLRETMRTDAAHRGDGILGPDLFGTRDPRPLPQGLPFINAEQVRTSQLTSLFDAFNLTGETPHSDLTADALPDRAEAADTNSRDESIPAVVHTIWLGGALPRSFEHNLAHMAAGVGERGQRLVLWTDVPREAFESASRYVDDPLTEMLDWARANDVVVLNVDEFFSAQAPMVLHEQYGVEMDKLVGRGYAAASDILRLEILNRFGGLYTDVDNEFVSMDGISELFRNHGFAVHNDGGIGNSALLAARGHDSIGTALAKVEANYRLTQEELYAQHGWPYRHEAADMRETIGQDGQGALRRHSIFARTGPNAMGDTLDELGYRREPGGALEYPDLPRIETDQFTMGQANSWLRPVPLSAERRWSDDAAVNVVAPKVVSTLLRHLRNRPGDLYLTAVAPVIEGTPDPHATWGAVLDFIDQQPGVPESIRTVTHRVVFEQAGDLARRNIPDYVLRRFGLDSGSPGQWVLGEMRSDVDHNVLGAPPTEGRGPGDEPPETQQQTTPHAVAADVSDPGRDASPPPDPGHPGGDSEPPNREGAPRDSGTGPTPDAPDPERPLPSSSGGPREAWGEALDQHADNEGPSTSRGKRRQVVAKSRLDAWDDYVAAFNEHHHGAGSSERGDGGPTDFRLDGARRELASWGITGPEALLPAYRDLFEAAPHDSTPPHDSRPAPATLESVEAPSVHSVHAEPPTVDEPPREGDGTVIHDQPPPYPGPTHDARTEVQQRQPESRQARELIRQELQREDFGEGVPIPPPYSAARPDPPFEGYPLHEPQFGRPAPRPEAFASTLAEVRRRLQGPTGNQLPDDVDHRIATAYDLAVAGLPEDLRRNYVQSGWSPTLLRELHHRVGQELGVQHPAAPAPIDPAAPRPGGGVGLPPNRAAFPGMVGEVRTRLADRFRELPPDIDDLIAIAYEQLPEGPRRGHSLGFNNSAMQAMYDRVKSQLNQAQTPRRSAVGLRRLIREARSGPSTSANTSEFGIPEAPLPEPRPADPGPAEPRLEKSEVVTSRFVTPRTDRSEPGPSGSRPTEPNLAGPRPSEARTTEARATDPAEQQRSSSTDAPPEVVDDAPTDHPDDAAEDSPQPTPTSTLRRPIARRWGFGSSRFGESSIAPAGSPLPTQHTAESLAVRYPWLDDVNPQRDSAEAATNCVISAFAFVISEREGESFQAPPTDRLPGRDLVNFHRQSLGLDEHEHQVSVIPDFDSAAQALKAAGPGAMAMIAIGGEDAEIEHVYVAVVDEHGVSFLDPHRGTLAVDPDDGRALAMLPLTEGIPPPPGSRLLTTEEIEEHDDQTVRSDTPTVVGTPLESEDPYFKPFQDASNAIQSPKTGEQRSLPELPTHEPMTPIPHSDRTIEQIRAWFEDANLDGDPGPTRLDTGPMVCGPATLAVFHWLSGTPVDTEVQPDSVHPDDVGHITGLPLVPNTTDGIAQRLETEGPGAHTVIAVRYRDGDTHSFNAYYDGHQVYALDGQRGTTTAWPPELDRRTNPVQAWFMGTPFHGDESEFSMLDRAIGPVAGIVPQRTVLRGLPPDDSPTSEDQAPHTDPPVADPSQEPQPPAEAPATEPAAQSDSAELRVVSGGQRDAWARQLEAHAVGGAEAAAGKGKQRAGAPPEERLQAWDRYVNALNARHESAGPSEQGDTRPPDSELDSARRDLAAWGIAEPEALLPAYRGLFEVDPHASTTTPTGTPVAGRPDADAPKEDQPKAEEPKAPEPKAPEPKVEVPLPKPDPPLPARIGSNLVLGGIDVLEEFRSGDQGLEHIKQLVIDEGGDKVWQENEKQLRALFSDDGVRPEVPGMLRGGQTIKHTIHLAPGRAMTVEFAVNGADERSQLDFKENTKYEFEHTSDSTNTVGSSAQRRTVVLGGVQGNVSHPNATETVALFVSRAHDKGLTELSADRQVSGAQTAEAAVRFHGSIQATITHRLSSSPDLTREHELSYHTQVVVPARDVKDRARDFDLSGRESLELQPDSPDDSLEPTAPLRVEQTHRLNGSDVVTNLWLLPDDPTHPGGDPRPQPIHELLAGAGRATDDPAAANNSSMRDAFEKAYGKQLADEAIKETEKWLTVERLQANLHGMTNKQPLVLDFKGVPGGKLVVHAFIEPLGTSPARGQNNHDRLGTYRMMRGTGETGETEFHYGTEADTSQTRQDAVTWSQQIPLPGRARGQGGIGDREAQGGLDGVWSNGNVHSETESRQFRVRNTLKTPAAGQAWHGQARLRFEMHVPDGSAGAVHETRARFDVLTEKSETTPASYRDKVVWAPPQRIWGDGPPAERNSVVAKPPWWRFGTGRHAAERAAAHGIAKNLGIQADHLHGEDRVPALRGLGSMDRVTNLDLSGFHGMLDSMGRRAFGGGWKDVGPEVSKWYHLNRVRGAISSMSQHSPLTRTRLSGKGTKVAFTADFEQLTYKRTIKTLSSPSMEITEGTTNTSEHNRQISEQGALGGRGGDVNDSTVLAEVIGGVSQTDRNNDRVRNQQRVAVATKFEQEMAIFEGWLRLDGSMTGSKATVHESGLFPVEIAIPVTELHGSRIHDSDLPPTFTRQAPTGFVDEPAREPVPELEVLVDLKPAPQDPFADPQPSTSRLPGPRRRPDLSITPVGFRPASPDGSRAISFGIDPRGTDSNLIELSESPPAESPLSPRRLESPTSPSPLRARFESPVGDRTPAESRAVSPAPSESPTRQSTTESRTPLISGRQDSDDSSQGRRLTGDSDTPATPNPFVPRPSREVPLSRQVFGRRFRPNLTISPGTTRPASPTSPARSGAASPVDEPHDSEAIELTDSPTSEAPPSVPWLDSPTSASPRRTRFDSPTGGLSPASSRAASPGPGGRRRSTDELRDTTTPFIPERGDYFSLERQHTLEGLRGRDSIDSLASRQSSVDSTTALVPRRQDSVDSTTALVPHRQDTVDTEPPPHDIGPWTSPGLRDIADNHRPPPVRRPDPPDWEWTKKSTADSPRLPSHALPSGWHPSDMLVGVDPASGLIEAFRQDLEPALGGSIHDAMIGLSNHFGPRVLAARLTHQSGQTWSHDITVPGGKITVKVRPERLPEGEYVGSSGKFETDLSIESQSSTAQTHGASLRTVAGGRVQVPLLHGSVAVQLTHAGSIRPKDDIEGQGIRGLSGVNTPAFTGDIENRVPLRTRTTQAHELFRQPIRFHISYEQHVLFGPMKGIPEAPQPVRLHGVFSYAKEDIAGAPAEPTTGGGAANVPAAPRTLEIGQTVVKIRPHVNPPAPQDHPPQQRGEAHTPHEDLVAAHVMDSMAATGKEVFGNKWPAVRDELAAHVKTIAIQRDLGDYSRGASRSIDLKSVPGGKVVLRGHLDTMAATGSKATTEFYTGGQESMTSTVSTTKVNNWQGYLQGQANVLPASAPVNLSVLARLAGALGFENTDLRSNSSATGTLFRKKVATLTHGGMATVEAEMSRPPGGSGLGDKTTGIGKAQVDFVTRESPTDNPAEQLRQPRNGIIQKATDPPVSSTDAAGAPTAPQRGLSHDSIVRKIVDGDEFRATALRRLSEAGINGIDDAVGKSLNDTRLASKLPEMTRTVPGDRVELMRQGKLRITGRADVQDLKFTETEKSGGNAYVLNDVNQSKQNQHNWARELGFRLLLGPRAKGPGVQGYVLFGGGATTRRRFDTIDSAAARVSANAKFGRTNAVFDATTKVFLYAHDGDTQHPLGSIDVHGPVLIPESETEIVSASKEPDEEPAGPPEAPPQPVEAPPPAPEPTRPPAPDPTRPPTPAGIETREQLATEIDRIAGPQRVVPTADDPRDDPQACTILLDKAVRTLYPDRLATLPSTGRTLDDSVLDGRPVSRLIGGAEPAPVSSWPEVANRLNEAAGPDGRATALMLVQRANGIGHALGAHRFANGDIAYFDLHRDFGDRVLDAPPQMSLARASAVILDGEGRDVTRPQAKSPLVDALTDPIGDPRYGRGGVEAEYRGGYLVIPPHLFDPNAPDADERINEQLGWLARNERSGIKIVVDTGVFDVTEDDTRAMVDQVPFEHVRDRVFEPVAEFVTSRPIAELRTDAKTNTAASVKAMQHSLVRLDGLPRPKLGQDRTEYALSEILPHEEGWEVNPDAAEVKFVPVITGDAPTVAPHHTKGVPLGDVKRFMRSIAQRVKDPELSQRHRDGEGFARSMDAMFRHWTENSAASAPDRPDEVERRELYGAMWLTYLHVSAFALATTSYPAMAKHGTAVALRQSLRTVHNELSSRAQVFLNDNAGVIRQTFEREFLSRETAFSQRYVAGRARALRIHATSAKFHVDPPQLSAHDEHRPLQAIRYAPLEETHSRHTLMVGDYLDTMLLRDPAITVNQYEAFGVHSHFPDLDREGSGPGLVLLELRNDSGGGMKPERLGGQYTELTRIVRDTVEPSPAARLGRSLTRAAKGLRNLARGRVEAGQSLSGAEPQALLSPEPVAAAPVTHHTGLPIAHSAAAQTSPTHSTHDGQSRSEPRTEPGSTGRGQAPSARSSASVSANHAGLSLTPPAVARSTNDLATTSVSLSADEHSVSHDDEPTGSVDDADPASNTSEPEFGPVLRLRGGAGEGAVFRQTLKDYARRIFGTGDREDRDAAARRARSDQLIEGLQNEARQVQQARTHPVAEDRFGPDPFGFRDLAQRPTQLTDIRLADVPTERLGSHIRRLDMAAAGPVPPVQDEEFWSEPVSGDARRWPAREDVGLDEPLPRPLEMPKVIHSIWLGGPVTDGRKVTDVVRQNLEKLSRHARRQGMQVVLWTDVPRSDLASAGSDAARMLRWARDHDIALLSPDEIFHVDEPMNLATEYRLETAKATAAGYTAASDILRLEVLHRFGGVYTDHDNEVRSLDGLRNLLAEPGFAMHSGGRGLPNNSAILAARHHPFIKRYLEVIRDNYRLLQKELAPQAHSVDNSIAAQREKYVAQKAFAIRRRSVTERTGPFNFDTVITELGLTREQVPRISTDQLRMGTAHTWLSTKPRRFPAGQTPLVLQHAVSGLIWDLRNRQGDLNLAAVAPLIEGLPDPAAGWEAVVGYIHSVPELRTRVRSVTYSYLRPRSDVPVLGTRGTLQEIDLPRSVLDWFGLPRHGHAMEAPGVWRRAAFGTQVQSPEWGVAPPSAEEQIS